MARPDVLRLQVLELGVHGEALLASHCPPGRRGEISRAPRRLSTLFFFSLEVLEVSEPGCSSPFYLPTYLEVDILSYKMNSGAQDAGQTGYTWISFGYPLAALGSEDWCDAIHAGVFSGGRPSVHGVAPSPTAPASSRVSREFSWYTW